MIDRSAAELEATPPQLPNPVHLLKLRCELEFLRIVLARGDLLVEQDTLALVVDDFGRVEQVLGRVKIGTTIPHNALTLNFLRLTIMRIR